MALSQSVVSELKSVLSLCKSLDIETVVFKNGKILGANDARNLAIVSNNTVALDEGWVLAIGRLADLEKRFALFSDEISADVKVNDRGEISVINLSAGKSKAQYRCASLQALERRYPQGNEDTPTIVITMEKSEVAQMSKAIKTYSAESVLVKVGRAGEVMLECADAVNDRFSIHINKPAEFIEESTSVVHTYAASNFAKLMDMSIKDSEEYSMIMGEMGSISAVIKNHTFVIGPNITEE